MARMPQIPPIEYGPLPNGRVERAPLPSVSEAVQSFQTGARTLEGLAEAHEKIMEQKQKIVDTTTATASAMDFEEQLRGVAQNMREQFAETPEKAPTEFLKAARQMADDAVKNAPNSQVSLALAHHTASVLDSSLTTMHSWVQARMTQQAGNDLNKMLNLTTRGAEDQTDTASLGAYAARKHKELDPLLDQLTADSGAAKDHLNHEIAKAWAVTRSAKDPIGVLAALDENKGFLAENLTAEDRISIRKQAETSRGGIGKFQHQEILRDGTQIVGQAYSLFRDGHLTAGTAQGMQRALDQKRMATSVDPNMPEDDRKKALADIDLQTSAIQALDAANRKETSFDALDDEKHRGQLIEDHDNLFKKHEGRASHDLGALLKFQSDLAAAYGGNLINRRTFDTMEKSVWLAMPKAADKEGKNTPSDGLFGYFAHRTAREDGNQVMNAVFSSFGKVDDKIKSDARIYYMMQINQAIEDGHPPSSAAAIKMATESAHYAAGKQMPRGPGK